MNTDQPSRLFMLMLLYRAVGLRPLPWWHTRRGIESARTGAKKKGGR